MLADVGFPVPSIGLPRELKVIAADELVGKPSGAEEELVLNAIPLPAAPEESVFGDP